MKTDTQIQKDVYEELKCDARVTATDIGVSAKNGVITINGIVPHFIEKSAAEEAAQRVSGVRAVANEINVKFFNSSDERNDQDIAEAALFALSWNYEVPDDIKVSVTKGCITLKGKTEWAFEKSAAENSVKRLMGVSNVINLIEIKSNIQTADIKSQIESAFKRSADREGKNIIVKVDGHNITLSGNVHSQAEKNVAKWAAYCVSGVSHVDNNLSVLQ